MRILALLHIYFMFLDIQASNLLPTPENVTLLSNNFNHILIWSPGRGTPQGTVYSINVSFLSSKPDSERRRVKTNKTILDISKYMPDMNEQYTVRLSALFGNRSSPVVKRNITPYIETIIGPPAVTMSGCGNCFNISFSLPVREGLWNRTNFYKGIVFYIRLKKAGEEKVITVPKTCSHSENQSAVVELYNCSVKNLQLGGNYCVQAQPHINVNENTRPSDWFCAFTSTVEERGVAFVAGWTICFVLAGLCLLIITASLVYTRSLCRWRMNLPKALTAVVPGRYFSAEETQLSVAEVDTSVKSNKTKQVHQIQADLHKKETKEQTDMEEEDEDNDDNDDDDDDNNDEGEISKCNYMDRGINNSDSQATNSRQSTTSTTTTLCEVAEDSGGCIEKFLPTEAKPAPTSSTALSQVLHQHHIGNTQVISADLRPEKQNLPTLREMGPDGGRINQTEADPDHNISLSSVRLMSLQTTAGDVRHAKDVQEPLVPLLIREPAEDRLYLSKPQTGNPTLLGLHTHSNFQRTAQADSQNEKLSKLKYLPEKRSDQPVRHDWTQTRNMAMHRGEQDTEIECLLEQDKMEKEEKDEEEDEEEDYTSGYMKR
ncbi:hypothetical protein AMEX_G14207 [Astyanax mexicanus]|uniref:Fibronectin type-III domain-containing protein n=1 Tax=Astyanax mexicanus TaxID=7994 RepID=A0A8T2LHT2_ASTMX|nr:hypothetical protein AMEX_G14207 [Astyanax mexicanus]